MKDRLPRLISVPERSTAQRNVSLMSNANGKDTFICLPHKQFSEYVYSTSRVQLTTQAIRRKLKYTDSIPQ